MKMLDEEAKLDCVYWIIW